MTRAIKKERSCSKSWRTDEEIVKALRKDKVCRTAFSECYYEDDTMGGCPVTEELVIDCNGFFEPDFIYKHIYWFLSRIEWTKKGEVRRSYEELLDMQPNSLCRYKAKQAFFRTCIVADWLYNNSYCSFFSSIKDLTKDFHFNYDSKWRAFNASLLLAARCDRDGVYWKYKYRGEDPTQKLDPSIEAFPVPDMETSRNIFINATTKDHLKKLKEMKKYDFNN